MAKISQRTFRHANLRISSTRAGPHEVFKGLSPRGLRQNPDAKILILTTFGDSEDLKRALDADALGAMVKDSAHAELIGAIREHLLKA